MGDLQEMKELVKQLVAENTRLIAALAQQPQPGGPPGVQQPDPVAVRAATVAKMALSLRKSSKVKDFEHCQDADIKQWLRKFDMEVEAIRKIAGLDGDLERQEYIDLLKGKLSYEVLRRLETAFPSRNPVLEWNTVTKVQLHKCLMDEFGPRESDVSAVLLQFGPNRCKKSAEMGVSEYYHKWHEQIPVCMTPTTNQERVEFVDLIMRSLFYYGLEDTYLQQQICDSKDEDPTLKKFFDIACEAEQKRKSFQAIGVSSSMLDGAAGVSVSKFGKWEGAKSGFGGKSGVGGNEAGRDRERPEQQQQQHQQQRQQWQQSARERHACYKCGKTGHFQRDCWSGSQKQRGGSVKQCDVTDEQRELAGPVCEDFGTFNSLEVVSSGGGKSVHQATEKLLSTVSVNGTDAQFQLDTAASG